MWMAAWFFACGGVTIAVLYHEIELEGLHSFWGVGISIFVYRIGI